MTRPTVSEVGQSYDRGAGAYNARHEKSERKYARIEGLIRAQLGRGDVLDLGCGTGRLLRDVPGRGVGIDASLAMLRQASPELHCAQADAHRLPFADSCFDAVVAAQGVMRYLDTRPALAEVARVLRPGGRFAAHYFGRVFSLRRWKYLDSPMTLSDPAEVVGRASSVRLRCLKVQRWRPIPIAPYALPVPEALPGQLWTHCVMLFEKAPPQ